jgi:hypothetical protein
VNGRRRFRSARRSRHRVWPSAPALSSGSRKRAHAGDADEPMAFRACARGHPPAGTRFPRAGAVARTRLVLAPSRQAAHCAPDETHKRAAVIGALLLGRQGATNEASGRLPLPDRRSHAAPRLGIPARTRRQGGSARRRETRGSPKGGTALLAQVQQSFEQFSNTTTGISGFYRSTEGTTIPPACSHFVPNRAVCFPFLPTLFRLDKAEVVGSSPTSPIDSSGYLWLPAAARVLGERFRGLDGGR